MSRYTKTQVTQLSANEQAAIDNINKNFNDIQEAINDTVSRSGNTPTHMIHDLDMNGKRIINVPAPLSDTDLVRRQDVVGDIALVQNLVNATTNAAAQTLQAAADVQEIIQDANVGLVADDLALDENSKIRICGNNIDKITSTANNISNVNAVADNEANINAVNANKTNINKVANDINRVNLVADDISSVHTVAIDISTVIDVADNKTNIDSVAGNETNINTCASNMAAITGASTQASNAANSATAAAASAQQAAISAAGSKFKLFHHDWFDYQLNDLAWLRADTFSWQDGTVYSDAYDHLVNDIGYVRYMIPDDDIQEKFYRSPSDDTTMFAWTNQYSTLYTESEFPQNGDNFYYHDQIFGTVLSTGVEAGSGAVTPTTETISGYTITYYPATDAHKIVLADQETTVSNIYNATGVAWYYILDTTNQRFKLPRENPAREELIQVIRAKGNGKALGFSDGYNTAGLTGNGYTGNTGRGLAGLADLYGTNVGTVGNWTDFGTRNAAVGVTTDSTKSGIISDMTDSTSVYKGKKYLYFYIGQFSQTATEQTAGLNSELFNGKADIDGSNMVASVKNFDGQWVIRASTIIDGASAPTSTNLECSLAQYLPNDNYNYEVILTGYGTTGNSSGNQQRIQIQTDLMNKNIYLWYSLTRTSSSNAGGGYASVIVGTDRKVYVAYYANNTGTFNLYARAYRRIGANS